MQKSTAVLALIRRLPVPWRWAGIVGVLPLGLRDAAYDWIAANRYRLMGKREICMIPTEEVRARFHFDPPGK